MPPNPREKTVIEKRRATVAQMCLAGASNGDVARHLGVSDATISKDLKVMRNRWRDEQIVAIDLSIGQQLAELDWMRTQVRGDKDMKLSVKVRTLLDIQQQEAKLLGLYAPTRTEVSAPEPIQIKWLMSDESNDTDT